MPKRPKLVYSSSSQVLHLWANQSQATARQGGRITRCYFEGASCYSYGSHYELGRIVEYKGIKVGIINDKGYSHTTSKHIREAYGALHSLMPRMYATTFNVKEALLENQASHIDSLMNFFSQRVFWSNYSLNYALTGIKGFNELCKTLGHPELILNVPKELISLIKAHIKACIKRQAELKGPEHQAKLEAKRLKKQAKELEKHRDEIEQWKRGGICTQFVRSLRPMLLRVRGSLVETSSGAEVPLEDALNLLRAHTNNMLIRGAKVGSFTFDGINNDIVKVGCHIFNLEDIIQTLKAVA